MIGWTAETLAATAVLMAVVLALRIPIARLFGARIAYALWLLPLMRAVLPPLPGWRTLFSPRVVVALPEVTRGGDLQIGLIDPTQPGPHLVLPILAPAPHTISVAAPEPIDGATLVLILWLCGAAAVLGVQMWRYRRFMRLALAGATPIGAAAGTAILLSDGVKGPVATGILRRRIVLPRDFSRRYSRPAQRLVLDHEAAHHDRGDLLANLAGLVLLALNWWNPIAWFAHRAFRADQELACDETVLARVRPDERIRYAEAVARSAGFITPATVSPLSPVAELKRRLRMMGRTQRSRTRVLTGVLIATGLVGAGLLVSASGNATQVQPTAPVAPIEAAPAVPPAQAVAPVPTVTPAAAPVTRSVRHVEAAEPVEQPEPAEPAEVREASGRAAAAARRAGAEARIAGLRAQEAAQRQIASMDVDALVRTSLDAARQGLAAQCAAQGHPVAAGEQDFGKLALCNGAVVRQNTIAALTQARDEIARQAASGEMQRNLQQAVASLDRQIAEMKAQR